MDTLRATMDAFLQGWRADLSSGWGDYFADVEPDLGAISEALTFDPADPVIPGRKADPYPGAPTGAHVFRAFDGVAPDAVRVVVIGQDPYPRLSRATGRAFEDGAWREWTGTVAISLAHLMQSALAARLGRPELAQNASGWATIRGEVAVGAIALEPLTAWFDRLQASGVLFVNAGWTLTRFEPGGSPEQKAHIALWRPLMSRLLSGLAVREGGKVVYLLLGSFAQRLFDASGVRQAAIAAGTWEKSIAAVRHAHPNTVQYFAANPLAQVNAALAAMQGATIDW